MKTAPEAYSMGYEFFRKHCLSYGTILRDEKLDDATGSHRKYVVLIQGWHAHIYMRNGVVVAASLIS